ncbi:MAG: FUSC family protein, partial [Actinobacteria bacterium]|nr:FUSC family protein [Actinomycetota bacterium]
MPSLRVPAAATAGTPAAPRTHPRWSLAWSTDAGLRGLRATLVIPALFAFADQVVGNLQMATFASFGAYATLVMSSFGGTRRDKALAHLGLALTGTALVVIGTLVSSSALLASLVAVPVTFVILFAGAIEPNAASGAMGALVPFVLSAVSAGTASMIPERLAGWWLASVAGTAAVLLLSPRPPADRLHAAGAALAGSLADELESALLGSADGGLRAVSLARNEALRAAFAATPYRPTGLAAPDQAFANLVESLEWCCSLVGDVVQVLPGSAGGPEEDRLLVDESGRLLRAVAALLSGRDAAPDIEGAERLVASAAERAWHQVITNESQAAVAQLTFHVRRLAVATQSAATDALIASRRADGDLIAQARRRWYSSTGTAVGAGPTARVRSMSAVAARNASLRSVWLINSLRGALALAVAVAVADLSGVQHAFWVALGTLSVLRTGAAATGATALRALAGTVAGFVIGSVVILAIGSDPAVLWAMLPVSVFVAAYCSGKAPVAAGQAAFTVYIAVLFNLIVPVGWKVGVVRIEDVALGCAVSVLAGVLMWPRGAVRVVADDLADAFQQGASYLAESMDWILGRSPVRPAGGPATVAASIRLDGALRGLLAEQGTKHIPKEHLWRLVGATMRLRLTARTLARAQSTLPGSEEAREALTGWTAGLVSWYDRLARNLAGEAADDRRALETTLPAVSGLFDRGSDAAVP